MNRIKIGLAGLAVLVPLLSCSSYNAYQQAQSAEQSKDWDTAVVAYQRALENDPSNTRFKIYLEHARREASRAHFEKGKTLRASIVDAAPTEKLRLAQMASNELELTVKLDPTNQYAAVELGKAVQAVTDIQRASDHSVSIDEVKRRAKANISKAQPPTLNPASDQPISLSFPHETSVKDIYRALGNAFGINILFDQAVKDDKISIELKDVTAQQALERVMQASNHFYKVLDEHTIIVVPDNPQARRDYEDLVIQTFYLSNGDAEQVTNVVRTMIEARNVFPLKALNAITIRDTADKVRIAAKIIEANDKARAEVVVDVELLQLDLIRARDVGAAITGFGSAASPSSIQPFTVNSTGVRTALTAGTIQDLKGLGSLANGNFSFTIPTAQYALLKSVSDAELLANPEMRISEGEKATLHIGSKIPVPVSTIPTLNTSTIGGAYSQSTTFQYQDIGIKVAMEPRVHHNREVTLKLTVEVSDQGPDAPGTGGAGQLAQPTFNTRTIETTIRLKDGETNFLAGLIQQNDNRGDTKTPFLGDIPIIGRFFTLNHHQTKRTDLVMTMTPHIIRIPDITEDDVSPMWVGTTNNLTFRGVSPRLESQSNTDPFTAPRPTDSYATANPAAGVQLSSEEPGAFYQPTNTNAPIKVPQGTGPSDAFKPDPNNPGSEQPQLSPQSSLTPSSQSNRLTASSQSIGAESVDASAVATAPRLAPQPANLALKPGEEKIWRVVGMDLEGLTSKGWVMHYDPRSLEVTEVGFGTAVNIDPKNPPMVTINRDEGTVRITSTDGNPITFNGGGEVLLLRVHGGPVAAESFLVLENPDLKSGSKSVMSTISGGRAKVQ